MFKLAALSLEQLKRIIATAGKHMDRGTLAKLMRMNLQKTKPGTLEAAQQARALFGMLGKNGRPKYNFASKAFGQEVLPPLGKAQALARKQLAQQRPAKNYLPTRSNSWISSQPSSGFGATNPMMNAHAGKLGI